MQLNSRMLRARFPFHLFFLVLCISLIGILNLSSAAKMTRPNLYLVQAAWIGIGVTAAFVTTFIQTRTFYHLSYFIYAAVNVLLVAVLVVGTAVKGSQRWIDIGFMNLQPSELAKISVVFALARYCSDYPNEKGYSLMSLIRPFNFSRPMAFVGIIAFLMLSHKASDKWPGLVDMLYHYRPWVLLLTSVVFLLWMFLSVLQLNKEGLHTMQLLAPIDIVLVPFLLILIEPDLGTAMIVMAIAASMILFCGVRISSIVLTTLVLVGTSVFAWNFVLKDYQKQRVEAFLNPEADIQGKGYHAAQSMIAIGSGQFLGKGPGNGTQTQLSFLPENHTDFAFAVLAEEWGFVGGLLLAVLYFALIVSMLSIASRASDRFSGLLCVGAASVVFWHVFINIGMVTGLLPVVGVPLPFMSYGGSSMLTQMTAVAVCFNVAVWRKVR